MIQRLDPYEDPESHCDTQQYFMTELEKALYKGRIDVKPVGVVVFELGSIYSDSSTEEQHTITECVGTVLKNLPFEEKGRLKPTEYAAVIEGIDAAEFATNVDALRSKLEQELHCTNIAIKYKIISPQEKVNADTVISDLEKELSAA